MNWPWKLVRELLWPTPFPLPRDTADTLMAEGRSDNFGLLVERYLAFGDNRGAPQLLRELSNRGALVPDFTSMADLIEGQSLRWRELADELDALTLVARPQWRVVVGKATNDILESGIELHPVFGFPVIPATALKGMTRRYAEFVEEVPSEEADALFGTLKPEPRRGDLLFLEGVPVQPPVIERDVKNALFGAYYRDRSMPPASYLSPSPLFFLTIGAKSRYQFGVASSSGDETAAERGAAWLRGALTEIGCGAKTAAGYGFWVIE